MDLIQTHTKALEYLNQYGRILPSHQKAVRELWIWIWFFHHCSCSNDLIVQGLSIHPPVVSQP